MNGHGDIDRLRREVGGVLNEIEDAARSDGDSYYARRAEEIEVAFREFDGAVPYKVNKIPTRKEALRFAESLISSHFPNDTTLTPLSVGIAMGDVLAQLIDYCLGIDAPASPTD